MFVSASEALNSDSTESNISSISNLFEAMPALIKSDRIEDFMLSSKRSADSESAASHSSSMSLGTGPLWWS